MYPTAARRRRRANTNTFGRSTIRRKPKCRPIEQLCEIHYPTIDITPDVLAIIPFDPGGIENMGGAYGIPDPRRETFNLARDRIGHISSRSIRHMAIRPTGVLPGG